jgi:hypothetical protein
MLRHSRALARSPHGVSQTIFNPGMSGVPRDRAAISKLDGDVCAESGGQTAMNQASAKTMRKVMPHPEARHCVFAA